MCAYQRGIERQFPACFLFLLDQSKSMEDPLGNSPNRKADELATALNAWLQNMMLMASKSGEIKNYMDIGVLGYRTDDSGNPIIEPGLQGALAGRKLVPIPDIQKNPLRMQSMTQKVYDDETGEMLDLPVEMPVWVEPQAQGGTPMCQAMYDAIAILDEWIPAHMDSFPPIVIHITDGESSDGDPLPYAAAIKERATNDGNVLLFNCHLSATAADSFMLPASSEILPDEYARTLFEMSSELPDVLRQRALADGLDYKPGSRCMAFNAKMVELIRFLDFGTKVALR